MKGVATVLSLMMVVAVGTCLAGPDGKCLATVSNDLYVSEGALIGVRCANKALAHVTGHSTGELVWMEIEDCIGVEMKKRGYEWKGQ